MTKVAELLARLGELHLRTRETPLFNPVFQLSLELSRQLEAGEISLERIEQMIAELECEALHSRAARLRALASPVANEGNLHALAKCLDADKFEDFRDRWEYPRLHAVFTAHPTFLLTPAQAQAVARAAANEEPIGSGISVEPHVRPTVTLGFEHEQAMRAIANAQDARDRIVGEILRTARDRWPSRWHELRPLPFRFATWVGYDMDGRTDIDWHTSISFRLAEKAERLARYVAALDTLDAHHKLLGVLRRAGESASGRAREFASGVTAPETLSAVANGLTADDPDKLLTLKPLIDQLEQEARSVEGDRAVALKVLAAAMRADGLGMGWIHFRVNAKQLHNAIRRRLGDDRTIDVASRGAVATLRRMLAEVEPLRTNFGALAIESSTAIRQFLAMAQILRHIDADAPIRMLVAECEQPATVLAALYFVRSRSGSTYLRCSRRRRR